MDLREAKRIISYAKKQGIKSIELDGLSVTFHDAVVFPRKPSKVSAAPDTQGLPPPAPEPTLEQINNYIYGATGGMG